MMPAANTPARPRWRAATRVAATLAASIWLAGCATSLPATGGVWPAPPASGTPSPSFPPPAASLPWPGPSLPPPSAPVPIVPAAPPPPAYPKTAAEISGQAVVSLMKQAETDRAAGRFEQASANLERAQRIEPRNYFVWSALASLYLAQGLNDQAESVALKSTSLARGNVYVDLENWKTIAASRQARGDAIGALQARAKVDELQRGLGG